MVDKGVAKAIAGVELRDRALPVRGHTSICGRNGRTGRALALWELYRRGFDTHHIFSVTSLWENRLRYSPRLQPCDSKGGFDSWLE